MKKLLLAVAHREDLSLNRGNADAKMFGIRFSQFGNVSDDLPFIVTPILIVECRNLPFEW